MLSRGPLMGCINSCVSPTRGSEAVCWMCKRVFPSVSPICISPTRAGIGKLRFLQNVHSSPSWIRQRGLAFISIFYQFSEGALVCSTLDRWLESDLCSMRSRGWWLKRVFTPYRFNWFMHENTQTCMTHVSTLKYLTKMGGGRWIFYFSFCCIYF